MKDSSIKIDNKNVFDQPINKIFKTYEDNTKIAAGQGDDDTTSCLWDYPYLKEN